MCTRRLPALAERLIRDFALKTARYAAGRISILRFEISDLKSEFLNLNSTKTACYSAIDLLESRCLLSAALDLIGVTALRADPAFSTIDGSGQTVVVIDTGVDFTHPLLSAARTTEVDEVYGGLTETITDEHGTHVAGIIGARDANIGVAMGVNLIGIQVFTKSGSGDVQAYDSDIEKALAWVNANAAKYNVVAVNMSLGSGNYTSGTSTGSILYDDVKRLEAQGVTVVSAAGNSYGQLETPGSAAPGVFSTIDVGAVYQKNEGRVSSSDGTDYTTGPDRVTFFSQRPNTANEVFAPGAYITSTVPGGGTKDLAGTSMAAPMVTGTVALMQEAATTFGGRKLTPSEVQTIIHATADKIIDGDDENTSVQTTGLTYDRVNAYKAVQYIKSMFGGGGMTPGAVDPNGTLSTAVDGPVLDGSTAAPETGDVGNDGSTAVGTKDVDLYRFTVNAPGSVTISAATNGFQGVLRVFDATGTVVSTATGADATGVSLTAALDAGTFYVGVTGLGNASYNPSIGGSGSDGATGTYTLSFALDTSDADGVLTGATPISLGTGAEAQALNASIGADGDKTVGGADVDFYRVTVPDDGTLLVDIDTPNATPFADTYLVVYNASGTRVATSDDNVAEGVNGSPVEFRSGSLFVDASGAFQGHRTDSFIGGGVNAGDVLYIAVCNYDNRAFAQNSLSGRVATGSTGAYSLFVSFRNYDVNGAIAQAVTTTTLPVTRGAGIIGSDGSTTGLVDVGNRDVDFIKLNSPSAGILKIDIDSLQNATDLADTVSSVARLFSADGKLLAISDNTASNRDPLLYYSIDANTDYFLAVSGKGNDTFDPNLLGSGGAGDTGYYYFNAQVLDANQASSLSDDTTAGGQVQTLTLAQQTFGDIGEDNGFSKGDTDVDLYRYTPGYDASYTFTAGPKDDFGVDTYLRVFDASGHELGADDNGLGGTRGSKIVVNLSAGQTYYVGVTGAGPDAGSYNPITGAGTGSGATGGYFLEVTGGARTIHFDRNTKASYIDLDGSTVIVSMKGNGEGTVHFDTANNSDAASIELTGTDDGSSVTIKGDTSIKQLSVAGSLKSFTGTETDLTGNLSATGDIRTLKLRGISNSTIAIGPGGTFSLSAGDVSDTDLNSQSPIKSLAVQSWFDLGGTDDTITSSTVSSVSAKGDFAANVTATSIGKVKIGGALSSAIRSGGNIDSVSARTASGARVFAGVADSVSTLPSLATDFANPNAVLKSFSLSSRDIDAFSNTLIAAPSIRKANLRAVDTANNGVLIGLAADVIGSLSGSWNGNSAFKYKKLADPLATVTNGDVTIRLI